MQGDDAEHGEAAGGRPDIISGAADDGLLRPPVCVACGRTLMRGHPICDPASDTGASGNRALETWPAAPAPAVAARAWLDRLSEEGASLAYYVGLCGWLAAHPAHLEAYLDQVDRHVADPLKPLRRR